MIGLDTNVLIRYLTQDDPKQSKAANELIEQCVLEKCPLMIGLLTLCETVWVLERAYKLSKSEIVEVITALLTTTEIVILEKDLAWKALSDYEESNNVGFSDSLIGRENSSKGCSFTYTFDKMAAKNLETFHLLN